MVLHSLKLWQPCYLWLIVFNYLETLGNYLQCSSHFYSYTTKTISNCIQLNFRGFQVFKCNLILF